MIYTANIKDPLKKSSILLNLLYKEECVLYYLQKARMLDGEGNKNNKGT